MQLFVVQMLMDVNPEEEIFVKYFSSKIYTKMFVGCDLISLIKNIKQFLFYLKLIKIFVDLS